VSPFSKIIPKLQLLTRIPWLHLHVWLKVLDGYFKQATKIAFLTLWPREQSSAIFWKPNISNSTFEGAMLGIPGFWVEIFSHKQLTESGTGDINSHRISCVLHAFSRSYSTGSVGIHVFMTQDLEYSPHGCVGDIHNPICSFWGLRIWDFIHK